VSSHRCPDPACTYENSNLISLSVHWRKAHKGTAEDLRVRLFHAGVRPTCRCGCGGAVKFMGIQAGFTEWIRGHVSRVKNNWGHNDAVQARSQKTRRELFEKGATTWNSGLTKATDERVAAYGQTQSANFTPERREERGATMTRSWRTGAITPLTGSAHSQWAGGVSALQALCRSHLYSKWTYPKLVTAGFRCTTPGCPSTDELHVHHDEVRFSQVLRAVVGVLGEPGDDHEKKHAVAEAVATYHLDRNISGVVLCSACHAQEHAAEA